MKNLGNTEPQAKIDSSVSEDSNKALNPSAALQTDVGMVLQLADGSIQACNSRAEKLLGMTAEQMQGNTSINCPWQTLREDGSDFPGETHPSMVALQTGKPCSNVIMGFYQPQGELIWLKINSQPLFQGDRSTPYAVVTTFIEIGQPGPRFVGDAPAQQQSDTLESISDGFFALDRNWRFTYVNSQAARWINRLSKDLIGNTVWEEFPESAGSLFDQEFRRCATEQVTVSFESFYGPLNAWYAVRAYPIASGIAVYFQDVTEQKADRAAFIKQGQTAHQQLAEIEAIYASAPIGLCFIDTDLRFVRINSRLAEINGVPAAAHIGKTLREILPQQADDLEPLYREVIATKVPVEQLEIHGENSAQPGVERSWLLSLYPLKAQDDRVLGVNVTVYEITDRKARKKEIQRLNQELQRRVNELQSIFDAVPVGIAIAHDPECNVIRTNRFAQSMLTVRPDANVSASGDEAALLPFRLLSNGQEIPPEEHPMQRAAASGAELRDAEFQMVRSDGATFDWLMNAVPLFDAQGAVCGCVSAFVDISDRKRAEAALRDSEERYRTLFESLDEGFCVIQILFDDNQKPIDYRFLEINPAFEKQTGLVQAAGKTARQLVPELENYWFEIYGKVALTGEPASFEHGSEAMNRWFEVSAFRTSEPQSRKVAILFKDISDRKQAENRLREQSEQLRLFVKHSPAGVAMFDRQMRYMLVSDRWLESYGLGAQNIVGRSHYEIFPELSDRWRQIHQRCLAGAVEMCPEDPFPRADGSIDWVRWEIHPWRTNSGEIGGIMIFSEVITDRKNAELALQLANQQVSNIIESITDAFIAIDAQWRYTYVNATAEKLLVRSRNDLLGRSIWEIFPAEAESNSRLYQEFHRVVSEQVSVKFEEFSPSLQRYIEVSVYPAADGLTAYWSDIGDRKRTEEELRQKNAILNVINESAPTPIFVKDRQGCIIYANPATLEALGKPAAEVIGRRDRDLYAVAELGATVSENDRRIMESGQTEIVEESPDGVRTFLGMKAPYRNEAGEVIGLIGISNDITKRKRAEVALQEKTKLLQVIIDSIGDGLILANQQGEFVLFNRAAVRIFGQLTNEKSSQEWSSTYGLFLPDQKTLFPEEELPLTRAIKGEYVNDVAIFVRHQDCEDRWISISGYPVVDTSREITGGVIVCRDITERKQSEAALQESEQRFRYMANNAPFMVWVTDSTGYCTFLSDNWYEFTGQTEETGLGFGWINAVHPEDREYALNGFLRANERQEHYSMEFRLGRKDGGYSWALDAAAPRFTDSGQFEGYIGSAIDITERKQVETERDMVLQLEQTARAEAERANRIKDEFLAVLSHELRSPLNPILGWSQLLLGGKLSAAKTAQAFETIERNARLQSQLIEDLLDVSRILQGKLRLNVAPVNVGTIILSALETVQLAAEAKKIQIQTILNPDIGLVVGDTGRLQQIVWNLLSNAVKFTPEGGRVEVKLAQIAHEVQIQVSDTGKGIIPDFLPYVFEHFRQEDGATTRKFGGLGLGLAIVRQLIELHGGRVFAESPGEGQGATFTVRLPLLNDDSRTQDETERHSSESANLSSLPLAGLRILVVDDEPDSRDFVAFVLEDAGAEVISLSSAAEVLLSIAQTAPDLIVSDIGMPEMDGYMLIRHIRTQLAPEYRGLVAIALTAYAGEANERQVLQAGFQKHLSKPIDPTQLVATVARAIGPKLKNP
ncbi:MULTISPECIES: PAS domain-containing protein [unclassified Microcoleus]|uniref:PAS domain-containing protein n=1 Tax=unclassified Microcoleus TaxID=2642155 RepID=UPI001D8BB264|nr:MULTISPECIES: PAS domain-containing protein [unclassified Microcoleus]TAE09376.1 MAG: PAS domain S-box protein [Oscillatoriales cyanobacterium]MCC3412626.1 PAS domain-containing protein [Microcoleus sp. PH2017_02_FOX_O_A]MCC3451084.1 PAS domain-containing protein [Microcoleus sp. PH2017_09_SFU_O_A]MCC3471341.1 PAS domain-containing protein [Microcoleus sp. PH2017_13_LAR_U_A]MCC3484049.1 PAS domain-containing protein [Microcoleus sp. PH2017_14_LAR_D_A]